MLSCFSPNISLSNPSSPRIVTYPLPIAPTDNDASGHHKLTPCEYGCIHAYPSCVRAQVSHVSGRRISTWRFRKAIPHAYIPGYIPELQSATTVLYSKRNSRITYLGQGCPRQVGCCHRSPRQGFIFFGISTYLSRNLGENSGKYILEIWVKKKERYVNPKWEVVRRLGSGERCVLDLSYEVVLDTKTSHTKSRKCLRIPKSSHLSWYLMVQSQREL